VTEPLALVGIDSLSLRLLKALLPRITAPHIRRVIEEGIATEALSEFPAYTPTNWATLITGARTGTHGVSAWHTTLPGEGSISTFDSRAIRCETIFEAAERAGLRSAAIQYPGTWPPRGSMSVIAPLPNGLVSLAIARGVEFVTSLRHPSARVVTFNHATSGTLSADISVLGDEMLVGQQDSTDRVGAKADGVEQTDGPVGREPASTPTGARLELRIRSDGRGDLATIHGPFASDSSVSLPLGAWSAWLTVPFQLPDGSTRLGSVRFKLRHVEADGSELSLVRSEAYPLDGFTSPEWLSRALVDEIGPFTENPSLLHHISDGLAPFDLSGDIDLVLEEAAQQVDWIVRSARLARERPGWDFLALHWHFTDNVIHAYLPLAERSDIHVAPDLRARALDILGRALELADRLVGGIQEIVGPGGHVVVVSDHGNTSDRYWATVTQPLRDAGLLVELPDGGVDYARSSVVPLGPLQLRVNLPRDPEGRPIDPQAFAGVQDAAIDALLDWREPATGKRVISIALAQPDAQMLGFWGAGRGDIVYCHNAAFSWSGSPLPFGSGIVAAPLGPDSAHHGSKLPTADGDLSSNRAMLIGIGPGLRRGYERPASDVGWPRLIDVVPTMCRLLDIDPPSASQGTVLWDCLAAAR
jgi:hypothetical protein